MKIGKIHITGEIGIDTTLLDVIQQVKSQSDSDEYLVKIDSNGGAVDSGEDIYNYLVNLGKPITTYTTKAYSIASMIFMAGTTRIIPEGAENALLIHLPWVKSIGGNHQMITDRLKHLKTIEDKLVDFYAKALEIDKNTIYSLLSKETFLSANRSLELGFATQLQAPIQAVARLHNNNEETQEQQSLMNKLNAKIDSIMNMLSGKIKAELVLQDSTAVSISFPDLSPSDVPSVDDKAKVDGKDADGEHLMPDGSKFLFEKGILKEIKPVETEETEDVAPVDAAEPEQEKEADSTDEEKDSIISELEAKIAELEAKLAEMMDNEQASKMLEMLNQTVANSIELEAKYNVLAKQIGSDFSIENKSVNSTITASTEKLSRAAQILNAKF